MNYAASGQHFTANDYDEAARRIDKARAIFETIAELAALHADPDALLREIRRRASTAAADMEENT
jgi:hypothetical protein